MSMGSGFWVLGSGMDGAFIPNKGALSMALGRGLKQVQYAFSDMEFFFASSTLFLITPKRGSPS